MNSQFSYELDERQIKILMLDAEADYDEALWNRFELMQGSDSKLKTPMAYAMPKINFEISRSIIIPILFVTLIGGLSALLFSFVDFKKKPNASQQGAPIVASTQPIVKQKVIPSVTKQTVAEKPKALVSATVSETPAKVATETNRINDVKETEKIDSSALASATKETIVKKDANEQKTQTKEKKKKRRKRLTSEELPTINSTSQLAEPANEPELDLK